jgi:hypothetical protein
MIVSSHGEDQGNRRDLSVYARLRLADLRADATGDFWGVFVERDHLLPGGLVLPLEAWGNPGCE